MTFPEFCYTHAFHFGILNDTIFPKGVMCTSLAGFRNNKEYSGLLNSDVMECE